MTTDPDPNPNQWGHDFRPAYGQLSAMRAALPGIPVLALTATATPEVRAEIVRQLNMVEPAPHHVKGAVPVVPQRAALWLQELPGPSGADSPGTWLRYAHEASCCAAQRPVEEVSQWKAAVRS